MNTALRTLAFSAATLSLALNAASAHAQTTVVPASEDVMASPFFQGADTVRGYPADNRATLRVSSHNPTGLTGAETIYLRFDQDFSAFTSPVVATLTLQSVAGGFNLDGSAANPFTVSAHGVSADPYTAIIDNTNPGGTMSWLAFYNNAILPADAAARTAVSGFGAVSFDVSALVNGWIAGTNPLTVIALTGRNHTAGGDFLHGFLDNSLAPGSTFLTLSPVPEPQALALMLAGLAAVGAAARARRPQA